MVPTAGLEPELPDPQSGVLTNYTKSGFLERSRGIKPLASAWKAEVLSLYELR